MGYRAERDEEGARFGGVENGRMVPGHEADVASRVDERRRHFVDPHAQARTMREGRPSILKSGPVAVSNDRRSAAGASAPRR